jgi:hypothetical protein
MNKFRLLVFLACLIYRATLHAQSVSFERNLLRFEWDLSKDIAMVSSLPSSSVIWKGTLLPAWWLKIGEKNIFVKAVLTNLIKQTDSSWSAAVKLDSLGQGTLLISLSKEGLRFSQLTVRWNKNIPAIISMYFGTTAVDPEKNNLQTAWNKPFIPDWQTTGFCVPGAKEGPAQSFFRSWDFGQSNISLGSFGPSMGSPYAAAFPRPLLFAGMGNDEGMIALGAGSIPDAAMSLRTMGARGCFEYVYNEDIWGAEKNKERIWEEPLRLSIAEDAWGAFNLYYSSFHRETKADNIKDTKTNNISVKASWNSWGTWMNGNFEIKPIVELAKQMGAGLFVLDGSWEDSMGTAMPNQARFPGFDEDVEYARKAGMDIGVWQSVGWVANPFSQGLTEKDLLLNKYGRPCKANWNFDPFGVSYFCLDPSSSGAREFLMRRTERLMRTIHPKLIKLDFGYGLPSPDMAVPRDPALRGEEYAFELVSIISAAAKKVDPDVAMMYYGISPLWTSLEDIVSLDDQGDLWYGVKDGHASWSVWASLLGASHTAISGSSGYDWQKDDEVVLNSCILGVPGAVLSAHGKNNQAVSAEFLNRRFAVNSWYRRTIAWKPLWLNSSTGNFSEPPALRSWGRLEEKNSSWILTSLVLRMEDKEKIQDGILDKKKILEERVRKIKWEGRWALISQDDRDIFSSTKLAVIPFDSGMISIPLAKKPVSVSRKNILKTESFTDWTWDGKSLTINMSQKMFENTAGFLVEQ